MFCFPQVSLGFSPVVQAPHVEARLVSPVESVVPNRSLWVGVLLKIDPKWHVYWKNPGDSGLPTRIGWVLPEGFTASEIQWPLPQRYPLGGLVNYGYEDQVLLMSEISGTAEAYSSLRRGEDFFVRARVKWLVCKESCIPGKADLELKLPVAQPGVRPLDSQWSGHFSQAKKQLPTQSSHLTATFQSHEGQLWIDIQGPLVSKMNIKQMDFFPGIKGIIENSVYPKSERIGEDQVRVKLKLAEGHSSRPPQVAGVFTYSNRQSSLRRGVEVSGQISGLWKESVASSSEEKTLTDTPKKGENVQPLLWTLFLAFLGGLILNLMPCVFPIIFLKGFGFLKTLDESRSPHEVSRELKHEGLAYTVGVLSTFIGVALILNALRSQGLFLGWGYQLQSPLFVILLTQLFFVLSLSFAGWFEIGSRLTSLGGKLTQTRGLAGPFFTGLLAVIVATPCTAPFMGTAIGVALSQGTWATLVIFAALGLGMAFPYLLLSWFPGVFRFFPRPGKWMETLKEFLAFPLLLTVIWLLWVLSQQVGQNGVTQVTVGLVVLIFSLWLLKKMNQKKSIAWGVFFIGLAVGWGASTPSPKTSFSEAGIIHENGLSWEKFHPDLIARLREEGRIVFVDFTAAWCVTCQVNKKVAIYNDRVISRLKELNVAMVRADWTNADPIITQALQRYGRAGVPLYLVYHGAEDAQVLPELLTPNIILNALTQK